MSAKRKALLDTLLLLFFAWLLILPLFRLTYLNNWPSIESTFIADARMLSEHFPHTGWQPLWYCGTRTDYIYPPALRYGTVLISRMGHVPPARAYHLYIAVFYVFGIAAVYWLVRVGSKSRGSALLASAAAALLSPSFLLLRKIRNDSAFLVPQRLHVLMAWGEGPHIAALCVLPAALTAVWIAVRQWRPAWLAAAGVLCALVTANNFYGATALAIFYPIMVWAVWVERRNRSVLARAAAIPLLAWGLCAFWLTPSYVKITLTNLKWVAEPGNTTSRMVLLAVVVLYGWLSLRAGRGRPERAWPIFVYGAALVVSVWVLGFFYFGLRISGDAARLVPELDLVLIFAFVEASRTAWTKPGWRVPLALVVLLAFYPSLRYLKHLWTPFPKAAPLETVYDYRMAAWVRDHLPGARVLPAGTVRFWFDAWADNAQPDGGSDQGMLNQILPAATYQILHGTRADTAVLWLQALGTDAAIVPGKDSLEHYRDYAFPEKFHGVLPVLYDDGHGTVVYGVPRQHSGIARIVDAAAMAGVGQIRGGDDNAGLTKYLAAAEDPRKGTAVLTWRGFDEADVDAITAAGESLLVEETWDSAWHAWENGKELPIHTERAMGFMLIDVPAGAHRIRMVFQPPLENRIGQVVFFLTGIATLGLFSAALRRDNNQRSEQAAR